jgi:hypothetical protein
MNNQNSKHIRVCILHMDFQYNLECMNMIQRHFVLGNWHLIHMDLENMDLMIQLDSLVSSRNIGQTDHQKILVNNSTSVYD